MTQPALTSPRTADHWWWRPGWGPGTRCYTVHITFHEQEALHEHARAWRRVLAPFSQLDLVPDEWFHLTMQGFGLRGEVDDDEVGEITEIATRRLARLAPFELTIGDPEFTPEAVRFEPRPAEPVSDARREVRAAIAEIWEKVPEQADGFAPHISAGYGNQDADAGEILRAIEHATIPPVTLLIDHVDVILLGRDEGMYTWNVLRAMPLRG